VVRIETKVEKVNEDNRGSIHTISGILDDGKEITILVTRKGYARGGCIHGINDEHVVVLDGSVKYWIGDDHPEMLYKGMTTVVPFNSKHMLVSQTDSIVMEWGKTKEEVDKKDVEMKKKVDEINART
jgi:mannose-6-phosphate isomerase-like protein (cupin superfamily)